MGLLASSRSLNAARGALEKMGLSRSQQDLDRIATHLIEEFELRNSRPVDPDLLALFVDGKYVRRISTERHNESLFSARFKYLQGPFESNVKPNTLVVSLLHDTGQ
jgi:hypothetical protein